MKLSACVISFAVLSCSAQEPPLVPGRHYVISEAKTISVQELQYRAQSKARGSFADAKLAAQRGDHLRAIKLFEKVLKVDPLFADARNDLAVELIVAGHADRAREELQQLLKDQPRFIIGYTNLAVVLCSEKNFQDAETVCRRALTIDPDSAKASLMLGIALYGQGKQGAEARTVLETAARSSPTAAKLLKEWFGTTDLADTRPAK